ncbi:MAG: hypothetical protein ACI8P0_003955 [Planctomycetaceae bacterium]|jgi:uncharacterized protein
MTAVIESPGGGINLAPIAKELSFTQQQVANVVALLDDDNTVPFITRYRKEQTGNLDEEQIRAIEKRVTLLRQLAEKVDTILRQIDSQGKLTPELRSQIEAAETLKRLDDLYLPYRPKRRSRAETAREKGLEPLAEMIMRGEADSIPIAKAAAAFVSSIPNEGVTTKDEALKGAADILAERISENVNVRDSSRKIAWRTGRITVSPTKKNEEKQKEFENYFDYSEPVWKVPPHRTLALNRGEKEEVLRIKFDWDRSVAARVISSEYDLASHVHREFLNDCVQDSLDRLIHPSIEREVRREITDQAEEHAIGVFARNLRSLLLQPPLKKEGVLAIDPGFRTGCKIAILDDRGQCLHTDVVYVTGSTDKRHGTLQRLAELVNKYSCGLIAIGNGTACRETEELVGQLIADHCPDCRYLIVNEAGASIYSASPVAREEFPDYDATIRGTISIGRRLQDPLSELVKIDAQHIGVGMYQHDMNQRQMKESLDGVVESCVNFVGVDLNTASASLLKYVSGFSQLVAKRVVEWREKNGPFATRKQLLEVAGVGKSTFTQAAGFLKISNGAEPLDQTWIHPESYQVAHRVLENLSLSPSDVQAADERKETLRSKLAEVSVKQLATELDVGQPTLKDIIDALRRPGRDPRADLPGPIFRSGVLKLDDLATGMELEGTVLNVVDFGAFVDIGLKDTGLVHVSQMADRFISSPHEVVSVGDIVTVWVQSVDKERRRVSLTMKKPA